MGSPDKENEARGRSRPKAELFAKLDELTAAQGPNVDAKQLESACGALLADLSEEERAALQELLLDLGESSPDSEDDFSSLAASYDLSVDDGDIELFLAVDLARCSAMRRLTRKALTSDAAIRERVVGNAVDRALVGLRLTGISGSGAKALRAVALQTATEILESFKLSIIKNPSINCLREALAEIYERFLLWMRVGGRGRYRQRAGLPAAKFCRSRAMRRPNIATSWK